MIITKNSLIQDMIDLGINKGETILVHSSMKSLGGIVEGDSATVIEALLTVLGEDGTLLMPSLTYRNVTKESPFFSVKNTPSCLGKLSEDFRVYPGVKRSVHPTHSICAIGRHAEELTCDHIHDHTPVGSHSPLRRMMAYGGRILMLGCGLTPNTFMHGVEEAAGVPYVLSSEPVDFTCELESGQCITSSYIPHNFFGVTQRYDRVSSFLNTNELQQGKISAANCYILDCNALWMKALATMQKDPYFFIDRIDNNN